MKQKRNLHVCLMFNHNNRPDRERLSGACRFASTKPDWEIRILDRSSRSFPAEARRLRKDWAPDGVIYTGDGDCLADLHDIDAMNAAKVELDPPETSCANPDVVIRADGREIIRQALDLMTRHGLRQFAYYGTDNPEEEPYSAKHERHFKELLETRGLSPFTLRERTNSSWSGRLSAASDWVLSLPKPCGIIAYNDELGRNLLNACRLARLSVPEQVQIIGTDDTPEICETCRPTLSSIRLDFEMAGYLAAESLDQCIRRKKPNKPRTLTYGVHAIVERQSSRDIHGCGRIVSAANELIRTMPIKELSGDALATRLRVSRRLLEMDFRKVLGKGVHESIIERRLREIAVQLTNTDDPISEISSRSGFRTAAAARIAFRKHFGVSMSSFRSAQQTGNP